MDQTKLAPHDFNPIHRRTDDRLPTIPESTPTPQVTPDVEEPASAIEAIRYLFLARELRGLGQTHAADRWQAKATAWLARISPPTDD